MVMTHERETAMESLESRVADHYSVEHIVDTIKAALKKAGADPDNPTPDDLKPVDEFHTGGQEATDALLDQLEIDRETRVLLRRIGVNLNQLARAANTPGAAVPERPLGDALDQLRRVLAGLE